MIFLIPFTNNEIRIGDRCPSYRIPEVTLITYEQKCPKLTWWVISIKYDLKQFRIGLLTSQSYNFSSPIQTNEH